MQFSCVLVTALIDPASMFSENNKINPINNNFFMKTAPSTLTKYPDYYLYMGFLTFIKLLRWFLRKRIPKMKIHFAILGWASISF